MSKNIKTNLYTAFVLLIAFLTPVLVIPNINNPFFNSKGLLLFALAIGTLFAYILNSFKEKKWLLSANPLVLPLVLFGGSILLSALITHQYPYDQLVGWGGFFYFLRFFFNNPCSSSISSDACVILFAVRFT